MIAGQGSGGEEQQLAEPAEDNGVLCGLWSMLSCLYGGNLNTMIVLSPS